MQTKLANQQTDSVVVVVVVIVIVIPPARDPPSELHEPKGASQKTKGAVLATRQPTKQRGNEATTKICNFAYVLIS